MGPSSCDPLKNVERGEATITGLGLMKPLRSQLGMSFSSWNKQTQIVKLFSVCKYEFLLSPGIIHFINQCQYINYEQVSSFNNILSQYVSSHRKELKSQKVQKPLTKWHMWLIATV